jgi:hypothetical protein
LRSILRKLTGVLRYQLQQERPGHVRILVVASPGADADDVRAAIEAGSAELLDDLEVEVAFTDSLPRTEAGKVRSTVS